MSGAADMMARDAASALLGMVVINLPLPAEIGLYGQLLGLPMPVDWTRSWAS